MSSNSARSDPPGQLGAGEFVALLAMLMALQALGVDSMLPALDRIAHDLHVVSANQRQLVIGVFLFRISERFDTVDAEAIDSFRERRR